MLILRSTASTPLVWLDLPHGVRVQVPPINVAVMRAAEYRAGRAYSDAKAALGIEDGVEQTDDQVADLDGIYVAAMIRSLAGKIVAWEGLADEAGFPLPVSPEALDAFADHPILAGKFRQAYEADVLQMSAEGNVSAPGLSGDTAAARRTAKAARADAPNAPAP